jgi:hypothetical protein
MYHTNGRVGTMAKLILEGWSKPGDDIPQSGSCWAATCGYSIACVSCKVDRVSPLGDLVPKDR